MTAPPQSDWSSDQVITWLEPGFLHLETLHAESEGDAPRWEQARDDFLRALDVRDRSELESRPELRTLHLFVDHLERELSSDDDRWSLLLSEDERRRTVDEAHTQWMTELAEQPTDGAADEPEPTWVEGHGWMRYDPTAGEWVHTEGPDDAAADEPEPTWVEGHGWMRYDPTAGEWVHTEGPDDAAADEPEPTWVEGHGWMRYDPTAGEWIHTEGPDDAAEQVDELGWVTTAQVGQLEELEMVMGAWREWLPTELDGRASGWRQMDEAAKVAALDGFLPLLVLPTEELDEIDEAAVRFVDEVALPAIEELTDEEIASLSQEDVESLLREVLAENAN